MMDRHITVLICGCLTLLAYMAILVLIFCDLRAGVRKARKRGEKLDSQGYKRTIEKIAKYYNMAIPLTVMDVMQLAIIYYLWRFYGIDIIMIPWFSLLALGYVAWVEIHSIWEPADVKERRAQREYRQALMALIREYGTVENLVSALKVDKEDTGETEN